jgi:hypothetical protein
MAIDQPLYSTTKQHVIKHFTREEWQSSLCHRTQFGNAQGRKTTLARLSLVHRHRGNGGSGPRWPTTAFI